METKLLSITRAIPDLAKNTQIAITVEGWPAAVAIISICGALVAIYAIKASCSQQEQSLKPAPVAA